MKLIMKRHFLCEFKHQKNKRKWPATITDFIDYGSHYEMRIESLSGITALFGKTSLGTFVCLPDFRVGCHLAKLNNENYTIDKLSGVINLTDATTIAAAFCNLSYREVGELYDQSRDY